MQELTDLVSGGSGEIIKEYSDIEKFRVMTNASSVMLARAAQWNLSIFRTNGSLDKNEIISDYLKLAIKYDNHFVNCKYVVQELLRNLETDDGRALRDAQSLREICAIWDLVDLYDSTNAERKEERLRRAINAAQIEPMDSETIVSLPIKFDNSLYKMKRTSPKSILLEYTREKKYKSPHFKTICRSSDRRFQSTVTIDGRKYRSSLWERNKRLAEQCAAIVCLRTLKVNDGSVQST